jgi:hypothetical protein
MTANDKLNRMWKKVVIHSQYLPEGTEDTHVNQFMPGLPGGSARNYIYTVLLS